MIAEDEGRGKKKLIFVAALLLSSTTVALAQYSYGSGGLYGTGSNPNSHYVRPYTRSDGTYVGGHYQTNPNGTQLDNFGTRGNYDPYTGAYGTRIPKY